jgi:small GTP-binding protein
MPVQKMTHVEKDAYNKALEMIELCHRKQTKELDLSDFGLTRLPLEICQLSNLTKLKISSNKLAELPPEIFYLANLKELDISNNKLVTLPPDICHLASLELISLAGNQLVALPWEVCQLNNLKVLRLSNNKIAALPPEIGRLFNLTTLELSRNRLAIIFQEIFHLSNLTHLILSNNILEVIPPEIGQLANLSWFDVSRNMVAELPPEICYLTKLTHLELNSNKLSTLPMQIGKLCDLQWLNLWGNRFSVLLPEIGQLASLEALGLDDNQLRTLPPEIGQLSKLDQLHINNNQMVELPPEIGQLSKLDQLHINNNQMVELPPEIGQLINLTRLSLSSNNLAILPVDVCQLIKLKFLYIAENLLAALPPEICQLSNLQVLYLTGNQLAALPPEIGRMTRLRKIILEGNCLLELPESINELKLLKELYLHGNDALGLPIEILGPRYASTSGTTPPANPQAILDHYFARFTQGERPLNEVRLVLVGRGGAGKTSLARRLVKNTFNPTEVETPGIAMTDWVMSGCKGKPVTAHVWDFAGQVITHSMHRYFLSNHTVYVLVLTQREDSATEDADYWLRLILSYSTNKSSKGEWVGPPVLVALNKWDSGAVKVDRGALQERYPFICGFVETDCENGSGIDELRKFLCKLMDSPRVKAWVRQGYPKQWWAVKEEIRQVQQKKPHISYTEWRDICAKCGVTDAYGQDAASRDLHMLGVALNYGEDERLRDNTVLSPNWLTRHCYALIRHAEKNQGVLRCEELASVLGKDPDGEHDARMHYYLLRLMERFEVVYPLGEEWPPECWLVPLALPDSQPKGVEVFGKAVPASAARLRYIYPSLPPGLVAQFIVRTHPLMEQQMQWASGTVLTLNGARALVRAVSKMEVEVTVIGSDKDARRDLAGLCREELCALNAQFSGMDVREKTEVIAAGEVVWVNVITLEQDEIKGRTTSGVETDSGTLEVDTKLELDEFGTAEGRLPEPLGLAEFYTDFIEDNDAAVAPYKNKRTNVCRSSLKPRIFISYNHSDERLRKVLELHLEVLKIQGLVHRAWHDRRIQPGMDWDRAIQKELSETDVVIFLTSTASLASGYINTEELRPALERFAKDKAVVVPIILERCDWVDTFAASPPLKRLRNAQRRVPLALPPDGRPIRSFSPQSDGWDQVAKGLKELLTQVKENMNKRAQH